MMTEVRFLCNLKTRIEHDGRVVAVPMGHPIAFGSPDLFKGHMAPLIGRSRDIFTSYKLIVDVRQYPLYACGIPITQVNVEPRHVRIISPLEKLAECAE